MRTHTACGLAFVIAAAGLCWKGHAMEPAKVQLVEDFDAAWQEGRWQFSNGPEFPGAKGSFERDKESAHAGEYGGKLSFDFSGGGNYVAAILKLTGAPEIKAVRVWIKNPAGNRLTFRYTDPTGQTLQRGLEPAPGGEWSDVEIECFGWRGHWGGANDGNPHGPPTQIALLVENNGQKQGALFFDDLRLVEGKPAMPVWTYTAARFEPAEGWHSYTDGKGAKSRLGGKKWQFDFSKGGEWVGITPHDTSLLGTPRQFRIRFRGGAPGHTARLRLATHFMAFERSIGEAKAVAGAEGEQEFVTPAPPGEGWKWYGGENDGRLHGPLRITGFFLECNGQRDAGEIELLDVRIEAECSARRLLTMLAQLREQEDKSDFVAAVRSLSGAPLEGGMRWQIRDWAGKTIEEGSRQVAIPPGAEPLEVAVAKPQGEHKFLEAEFTLSVPEQQVPAVQAYYMAPVAAAEGAARLEPSSPFGMGLYLYRYPHDNKGLQEMERAAKMGADAGVKWSREEFIWDWVEHQKGRYDWSFYDKLVATAARNGISIYGLLHGWSNWTKPYTPEGIEDYCRFATAAVEHFRGQIQHWEVWNEPNIFFWQGPRDMYAELLKQAYLAIKKANPEALVLGCSTAGIDHNFIKRTMQLGAPFDILTIHPYRGHLDDKVFISDLHKVAELVKPADGAPRQVWITEMGWATHTPHNSMAMDFQVNTQRRQAELIARTYVDAIASGAAPNISWYDFRNDGSDPLNFEHNMGIITRDFRPKPAYRAYSTMTRVLQGLQVDRPLDLGPGLIAYRFAGTAGVPAREAICLWSVGGDKTANVPAEKPMLLTGLMGDTEKLMPAEGKVNVPLRNEVPVFLTE